MRKLLLLLFLIPVLSWADCPTPLKNVFVIDSEFIDTFGQQHMDKIYNQGNLLHCEMHRCAEINDQTTSCVCENLGDVLSDNKYDWCSEAQFIKFGKNGDWMSFVDGEDASEHYFKTQTPTPAITPAQTPKVSIDDAKSQCTDIGFKAGTEKFGDCVLELMQ